MKDESIRNKIIDIIENDFPENQKQILESLAADGIYTTQGNIQFHLSQIGASKEQGVYKIPAKKLTFQSTLKDLILDIKSDSIKGEIYIFCIKETSSLIMNVICQNYQLGDLCFKHSHSADGEILTIETRFSKINFKECLKVINNIIG